MDLGFFAGGLDLVGGPMNMRIIHYFIMWAFIVFTMIHAYLANVYNFNPSKIIFLWKETPAKGH
jgi:Ni/Fe-hydrogenase 1 B-type cytochrome subunit